MVFLYFTLWEAECSGVESVEPANLVLSKVQQFSVTNPAVRPSGFGDSSFNLDRPKHMLKDVKNIFCKGNKNPIRLCDLLNLSCSYLFSSIPP